MQKLTLEKYFFDCNTRGASDFATRVKYLAEDLRPMRNAGYEPSRRMLGNYHAIR